MILRQEMDCQLFSASCLEVANGDVEAISKWIFFSTLTNAFPVYSVLSHAYISPKPTKCAVWSVLNVKQTNFFHFAF